MKNLILVCLVIFLSSVLGAQTDPEWLWASRAGSTYNDYGYSISRDNASNLYVTGYFLDVAQFGGTHITTAGSNDIYVAKLDPNGNWLWAVRAGGAGIDIASSISTDANGNSYIAGYFYGTADFGTHTLTSSGGADIFVAKLDSSGNWLWARSAGGLYEDWGLIVTYRDGYCYLTGKFVGTASFGTTNHSSAGSYDIFVARLDTNGNWLWVNRAGGSGADEGDSVSIDANGNCYMSGYFRGNASFGSLSLTGSGLDVFATKLDPDGNWIWVNSGGGSGTDGAWSISTDDSGNCNVTGLFTGAAVFGNTTLQCLGSIDIFVARLDSDGNWLWARRAGGSNVGANNDVGICIALENNGNCYVTGAFYGADADFGSIVLTHSGNYDYFITQLDINGNWLWAITGDGIYSDSCWGVCFDGDGNFYVTGTFSSTMNFGNIQMTSTGEKDVWVAKLSSGGVGIDDETTPEVPVLSKLYDAYPNPFHTGETTLITTFISEKESGSLSVYNLKGQCVASYELNPGTHDISFDSKNLASGVYLYRLKTQSVNAVKKLVLLK